MTGNTHIAIRYTATPAAAEAFRAELPVLARAALRAILRARKGVEIAHLQVRIRKHVVAVCSRVSTHGAVNIELDVGDPSLPAVIVTEQEFTLANLRSGRRRW